MYNPYQQNPYNPYLGQTNPYPWPLQPSVAPPPKSSKSISKRLYLVRRPLYV